MQRLILSAQCFLFFVKGAPSVDQKVTIKQREEQRRTVSKEGCLHDQQLESNIYLPLARKSMLSVSRAQSRFPH